MQSIKTMNQVYFLEDMLYDNGYRLDYSETSEEVNGNRNYKAVFFFEQNPNYDENEVAQNYAVITKRDGKVSCNIYWS